MKILIAGGSGTIGQQITKLCHQRGDVVHFLTTDKGKLCNTANYKGFYWNPSKGVIDDQCFNGVEAVINLSGVNIASQWTRLRRKKILKSRQRSLQLLNKSISKGDYRIKAFATASAIGIYPHSFSNYYQEDHQQIADNFLGKVVSSWEEEALKLKSNHDFPVAIIRTGMVLSEKGGALEKLSGMVKKYMGAVIGTGEQWQSWIHIYDIASIYLHCIDKQLNGIYNAVAPNAVTNSKFTHELAHVLGKPILLPSIPISLLKLLLGERAILLYGSQRVSSKKIELCGYHFCYTNINAALKDLILHKKSQLFEELA